MTFSLLPIAFNFYILKWESKEDWREVPGEEPG
jgi:hypothetical protein